MRLLLLACVMLFPSMAQAQTDWDAPSLGFQYMDIKDFIPLTENSRAKVPVKIGVVVVDVALNGPAAGKLGALDIITKIDQTQIKTAADLDAALKDLKTGDTPLLNGQAHTVQNGVSKWKKASVKLGPAKSRRAVYVDALVSKVDGVSDNTTLRHASTPESLKERSNVALIIQKNKEGKQFLLFRMSVVGNLVFVKKLLFRIDGKTYEMPVSASTDIGDQAEWDVVDVNQHKDLILALLNTKQAVTVRHSGFQEYSDRELSLAEIYAMRGVYQAFLAMGGQPL